jgi:hypothetical protein
VNLRIVGTNSIAERFGALAELREAGLISHLGLTNIRPHHLAEAQSIAPVVCVQNMYGIGASPEQKEFLRICGQTSCFSCCFWCCSGRTGEQPLIAMRISRPQLVGAHFTTSSVRPLVFGDRPVSVVVVHVVVFVAVAVPVAHTRALGAQFGLAVVVVEVEGDPDAVVEGGGDAALDLLDGAAVLAPGGPEGCQRRAVVVFARDNDSSVLCNCAPTGFQPPRS